MQVHSFLQTAHPQQEDKALAVKELHVREEYNVKATITLGPLIEHDFKKQ